MASNAKYIKDTLTQHWFDNYSETETEYENIKFVGDRSQPFVKFSVGFGKSFSIIKGDGTKTRHTGMVRVTIRVPVLKGTKEAYRLADISADILERKRIGTVTTRQASLHEVGVDDEYFILVVSIPFLDS